MYISRQKKKENIAEYLLYMWQIEDMVRSCGFDMHTIDERIIVMATKTEEDRLAYKEWYQKLVDDMLREKIEEKGHLSYHNHVLTELNMLHNLLLTTLRDEQYQQVYDEAKPNIDEFVKRSGGEVQNEIEACFNALYGLLMLRLQKREVSDETETAMQTFSKMLAYLSAKYKEQMTQGSVNLPNEQNN